MTHYSKEIKQQVLSDMQPPNALPISAIVMKYSIPNQTLYSWRKKALDNGILVAESPNCDSWSHQAKFAALMATANMTIAEKAEYCRQKGIFSEQLEQWQSACLSGFDSKPALTRQQKAELNAKDREINDLKKDISRKNNALAEAGALLVLSKKYHHNFEDEER